MTETAVMCCIKTMDRVGFKWIKMKRKMVLIPALNIYVIQVKFVFLHVNQQFSFFGFLLCRSQTVSAFRRILLCLVAEPLLFTGCQFIF